MSELTFSQINRRQYVLLPILDDRKVVQVEHKTAKAVIQPVDDELRIPYVSSEERGDFKSLMDNLVNALNGHNKIRFVGTSEAPKVLSQMLGDSTSQSIYEAVHGFEKEPTEEYTDSADNTEEIETLIGRWEPGKYD